MASESAWYFAYGANMLEEVFVKRRKIQPLRHEVACIKTHTLCFNVMGVPYADPAMGGIRLIGDQGDPVYGVAYLLTSADLQRVVLTEGGGIAYTIETLTATLQGCGSEIPVVTLVARHDIPRSWERLPSKRYMNLLICGAHEKGLPVDYQKKLAAQPVFEQLPGHRFRVGKRIFDSIWQRAAYWIDKAVGRFKKDDGNVPGWFLWIFDRLLWTMWFHHDYIHSVVWGRGDGLHQ
ncbi:Glik [Niveomyces insectorum RCEF 264]|uniref:gamma-glutamylcyclotransferase n=1 Tax=Niveomyces insectorum RCEF 264 TaxID=1081102 RepID=A0A167W7N9_9HYPO|nr:Glik [Niveomyces insectorum RCEF 264]